jgi:hypothetical protein
MIILSVFVSLNFISVIDNINSRNIVYLNIIFYLVSF